MPLEIERKFLVNDKSIINGLNFKHIIQGYISLEPKKTVRVRITNNSEALITIKSSLTIISKYEFEYSIPLEDAQILLENVCWKPHIEKNRHTLFHNNQKWEIDVFLRQFSDIVIAEIELDSEDAFFEKPDWLGKEVTSNPLFHNAEMVRQAIV